MWLFRLQILSPREHILLCPNLLGTLTASPIHWLLQKYPWQVTVGITCHFCPSVCCAYLINVIPAFLLTFFIIPEANGTLPVVGHKSAKGCP